MDEQKVPLLRWKRKNLSRRQCGHLCGKKLVGVVGRRREDGSHQKANDLAEDEQAPDDGQFPSAHILNDGARHAAAPTRW